MSVAPAPPLIVHIIYRLGVGGLENGLINLINNLPKDRYRHAIICLKDSTDFRNRLTRLDVGIYSINKKEGHDWGSFLSVYKLLKQLKPAIVHTRNLAAIEYQFVSFLVGVKARVHSEHGWDVFDPDGNKIKYQWVRRILKPFIHCFIGLSKELENYLIEKVRVSPKKFSRICNGVDTKKFFPRNSDKAPLTNCPLFYGSHDLVIGAVGRMHGVKDQLTLVKAFILVCQQKQELSQKLKLMLIGDGPLREESIKLLNENKLSSQVWLPGERSDVADIMRVFDIFVLPSTAEGISNTILEAMATALPVIATKVGGNPELVVDGETGYLVEPGNAQAMANKIIEYLEDQDKRLSHAHKGYQRIVDEFSLKTMVDRYQHVYDSFLSQE